MPISITIWSGPPPPPPPPPPFKRSLEDHENSPRRRIRVHIFQSIYKCGRHLLTDIIAPYIIVIMRFFEWVESSDLLSGAILPLVTYYFKTSYPIYKGHSCHKLRGRFSFDLVISGDATDKIDIGSPFMAIVTTYYMVVKSNRVRSI